MYCDGKAWPSRKSAQAACHQILTILLKLVAPILPHTAEEAWQRLLGNADNYDLSNSIHLTLFHPITESQIEEIGESDLLLRIAAVLEARSFINAEFELHKLKGEVKDSQDAICSYQSSESEIALLNSFEPNDLALMLKFSEVTLKIGEVQVEFATSPYLKCERCRLRRPDVTQVDGVPLSKRDRRALAIDSN